MAGYTLDGLSAHPMKKAPIPTASADGYIRLYRRDTIWPGVAMSVGVVAAALAMLPFHAILSLVFVLTAAAVWGFLWFDWAFIRPTDRLAYLAVGVDDFVSEAELLIPWSEVVAFVPVHRKGMTTWIITLRSGQERYLQYMNFLGVDLGELAKLFQARIDNAR